MPTNNLTVELKCDAVAQVEDWSCHGSVPVRCSRQAAFRLKATGLFQPDAEWRQRGLQKPLMSSKWATLTSPRVCQFLRQTISALMVLKNVSTAALSWQLEERHVSRQLRLGYLAPDLRKRLTCGRESSTVTLYDLCFLAGETWQEQAERAFGRALKRDLEFDAVPHSVALEHGCPSMYFMKKVAQTVAMPNLCYFF